MKKILKSYIESIQPYEPGKPIDEAKRELGLQEIIKLASNENPLGVSPLVKERIIENIDTFNRYPDGGCWRLKKKLSQQLGVDSDEIIFGNGSNEIIEFIAKGFIEPGDEVISSQYAFLVYPLLTKVCDGRYIEVAAKEYAYDLSAIAERITKKTKVVFLANPNNPTGTYFNNKDFDAFLAKVPDNVIVCLDEAYVDFVDATDYPDGLDYYQRGNVVVLRTFSKASGLAGFRIGYGLATKELICYFNKIRQPFNVNAVAQCAAEAVLDDSPFINKTKYIVRGGKRFLYKAFDVYGLEYIKSQTNFILVNIKKDSRDIFNKCLQRGVVVRDMKAYGFDTYIRITVGLPQENEKLVSILEELL
ncbi:MAG: histidinol-phosphate transaminase [Candidatus Omnitrophica bacterium]|nr:histidinol-phosphate transaminase [Candidatus Omnitrophota bacterium]